MKATKFILLTCAALTLLALFVPYLSGDGVSLSLWQLRHVIAHPYCILAAAVLPTGFAARALTSRLSRWQSVLSLLGFAAALFFAWAVFPKTQSSFGVEGAIGAKLMFAAVIVGIGASLAGVVKPEPARA